MRVSSFEDEDFQLSSVSSLSGSDSDGDSADGSGAGGGRGGHGNDRGNEASTTRGFTARARQALVSSPTQVRTVQRVSLTPDRPKRHRQAHRRRSLSGDATSILEHGFGLRNQPTGPTSSRDSPIRSPRSSPSSAVPSPQGPTPAGSTANLNMQDDLFRHLDNDMAAAAVGSGWRSGRGVLAALGIGAARAVAAVAAVASRKASEERMAQGVAGGGAHGHGNGGSGANGGDQGAAAGGVAAAATRTHRRRGSNDSGGGFHGWRAHSIDDMDADDYLRGVVGSGVPGVSAAAVQLDVATASPRDGNTGGAGVTTEPRRVSSTHSLDTGVLRARGSVHGHGSWLLSPALPEHDIESNVEQQNGGRPVVVRRDTNHGETDDDWDASDATYDSGSGSSGEEEWL